QRQALELQLVVGRATGTALGRGQAQQGRVPQHRSPAEHPAVADPPACPASSIGLQLGQSAKFDALGSVGARRRRRRPVEFQLAALPPSSSPAVGGAGKRDAVGVRYVGQGLPGQQAADVAPDSPVRPDADCVGTKLGARLGQHGDDVITVWLVVPPSSMALSSSEKHRIRSGFTGATAAAAAAGLLRLRQLSRAAPKPATMQAVAAMNSQRMAGPVRIESQHRRRVNCRDCTLDIRVSMVLLEIQPGESEHSDGAESVSFCASPVQNDEEKPLDCRLTNSSDSCSSGGDSAIVRSPVESAYSLTERGPVYTADTVTESCTTDFTYASVVSRLESDDSDTLPRFRCSCLPNYRQCSSRRSVAGSARKLSQSLLSNVPQTVAKTPPPRRWAGKLLRLPESLPDRQAAQSHRRTAESRSAGAAAAAHLWTRASFSPSQRQQQVQNRAKTDPRTINSSPGLSRGFPTSQMPLKCISGSWGKHRELWKEWRPHQLEELAHSMHMFYGFSPRNHFGFRFMNRSGNHQYVVLQVRSGGIGDPHPAGVPDEGAEVSDIVRGGQLVHPLGVAEVFVPRLVEVRAEGDVMLRGLLSYATEGTETFLFRLGMAERLCLYSVQLFQWSWCC
uniref:Rap-GAP domain-containing protein n=1 Tax=Macrostomum lignano TaxID=282301 RepID=A0A1I8F209_9PLAT